MKKVIALVKDKKLWLAVIISLVLAISATWFFAFRKHAPYNSTTIRDSKHTASTDAPIVFQEAARNIPFVRQDIKINPTISQDFSLSEVKNIQAIEKAYGFTFTQDELVKLEKNKFVIKNLLDTNLAGPHGLSVPETTREFAALYGKVAGDQDYKNRTQANTVFVSSDVLMNLFSILSTDLLKETENKYLYGYVASITKTMYEQAGKHIETSSSDDQRNQWTKVRNYFAVPYALLSTSMKSLTAEDYWKSGYSAQGLSPDDVQAGFQGKDKDADSYQKASEFIKSLALDAKSEIVVLADLKQVYDATIPRGIPAMFAQEFASAASPHVQVTIPFTLFAPRGTYTSSSLRRQYFRAVQWYQQIPFLMSSKDLTNYALDIAQLFQDNTDLQTLYKSFSSFIGFVVGESDDLDLADYVAAVKDLGAKKSHDQQVVSEYLIKRKPEAKIKALPVYIDPNEDVTVADEIRAIRGMRFIDQKFIPDAYWTSRLTQGDEVPAVNGKRLPDKASSLEVMSILGSVYATNHFPDLSFYADQQKEAIDIRLAELVSEANKWSEAYWQSNLYTGTLWTVSGLFHWLTDNHPHLPQFMQAPLWEAKTLLTGSGFWTELRHTSLLYAKQSFAELGGGGPDDCDLRKVPEPPKGYIEPQAEAYDRLYYTAQHLAAEYAARGFELQNSSRLHAYIELLNTVREYTKLELENNAFNEPTIAKTRRSYDTNKDCTEYFIAPEATVQRSSMSYNNPVSRWEELRVALVRQLRDILPSPIEGPILPIKDKRAAVVADVHTDKLNGVLEEGTGVPRIIFVAVKDANGPRLAVGFTYSQYENISPDRLTDEVWQKNFYVDAGDDYVIKYKPKNVWPPINTWFQELLGSK